MCDSLCYWTASDIFEEGPIPSSPFSSTYGLVTIHGIAKAHCNAFKALAKMRGARLQTQLASSTPHGLRRMRNARKRYNALVAVESQTGRNARAAGSGKIRCASRALARSMWSFSLIFAPEPESL
jgi:hypothetical protein